LLLVGKSNCGRLTRSILGDKLESVKTEKTVLIVTDGSEGAVKTAADIAAALKGNKVSVKSASEFQGNDILPAEAFFLGCEKPAPDSFAYLEDLLKHINLAGRPCGVFSPASEEAAKYLAGLVHDSEAALKAEPLLSDFGADVKGWVQSVVPLSFRPEQEAS
jgi:hypothetical protein